MWYRRNLPHWDPGGASIFLTWRLHGTLPVGRNVRPMRPRKHRLKACATDGRTFAEVDRELDRAKTGPTWLRSAAVAECVSRTIEAGSAARQLYRLHGFVVMPNHVHVLISPGAPLSEITKWVKGVSARQANFILGRVGQPFWQDESFDHWVRNEEEFEKIKRYIENNPVRAGLVQKPEEWPYSSASRSTG